MEVDTGQPCLVAVEDVERSEVLPGLLSLPAVPEDGELCWRRGGRQRTPQSHPGPPGVDLDRLHRDVLQVLGPGQLQAEDLRPGGRPAVPGQAGEVAQISHADGLDDEAGAVVEPPRHPGVDDGRVGVPGQRPAAPPPEHLGRWVAPGITDQLSPLSEVHQF